MSEEQQLTGRARALANIEPYKFKKGQCGNPNGRPKNRIPNLMKGFMTKRQVEAATELNRHEIDFIEQIILSLDIEGLQLVAKNKATPAYMKTLAMAAIHDMKGGKTKTMDLLRDRQFGAVKKTVDVTTNGQSVMPTSLTPKEAQQMIEQIEKNC